MSTPRIALLGTPIAPLSSVADRLAPDFAPTVSPVGGEPVWGDYDAVFVFSGAEITAETVAGWIGHPHLRVIAGGSAEEEARALASECGALLRDVECERKFLIAYPDLAALDRSPFAARTEITQTYLTSESGATERVRSRSRGGETIYTHTVKRRIDALSCEEVERQIDAETYRALLRRSDPARRPVEKTRYCVLAGGLYFELDVYPFWRDRAIVELELSEPSTAPIPFPREFRVLKEVTDDLRYKNVSLAREIPNDPI